MEKKFDAGDVEESACFNNHTSDHDDARACSYGLNKFVLLPVKLILFGQLHYVFEVLVDGSFYKRLMIGFFA
jgi:hypothetical protein